MSVIRQCSRFMIPCLNFESDLVICVCVLEHPTINDSSVDMHQLCMLLPAKMKFSSLSLQFCELTVDLLRDHVDVYRQTRASLGRLWYDKTSPSPSRNAFREPHRNPSLMAETVFSTPRLFCLITNRLISWFFHVGLLAFVWL